MIDALSIRGAGLADVSLISELGHHVWWQHYPSIISDAQIAYMLERMYAPEALAWQMTAKSQRFFIAYLNEEPVAFAAYSIKTDGRTTCMFLNKLYGSQKARGKGAGLALLNVGKQLARERGILTMRLYVNRRNSTVGWYRAQGFEAVGEIDTPFGPYVMDDYLMEMWVGL